MRDLKFRAWDKTEKRMWWNVQNAYDMLGCHNAPLNQGQDCDCKEGHYFPPNSFGGVLMDKNFEVMQFTGLKDREGVDIYEGDIVEDQFWSRDNIYSIVWVQECCSFMGSNNFTLLSDPRDLSSIKRLKVIGNIYANPELLTPAPSHDAGKDKS